jgi:hypothetical protein
MATLRPALTLDTLGVGSRRLLLLDAWWDWQARVAGGACDIGVTGEALVGALGAAVSIAMMISPDLAVTVLCLSRRSNESDDSLTTPTLLRFRQPDSGTGGAGKPHITCDASTAEIAFRGSRVSVRRLRRHRLAEQHLGVLPEETYRDGFRILGNLLFFF